MAPVSDTGQAGETLRTHLRAATMAAHDLLDHAMQAASGWQTRADYAHFLELQHAARAPLETWLAVHAPERLRPPAQTPLIARDLARLGRPAPAPAAAFSIPQAEPGADRGHALGAAWVLAGSALGNRSIAKAVTRIGGGAWPMAFLGDDAMLAFWQSLRSQIEQQTDAGEAEGATHAATAVFAHFLAVAQMPENTA